MTSSFRPDVFSTDPPTLLGSLCAECDGKAFPPREVCPHCGSVDRSRQVELSRQGHLYSFTVVRQAPPGLETPYALGYVDLPADQVRVMARIEGSPPEELEIGLDLRLISRPDERAAREDEVMFAFSTETTEAQS